MISYKYGSERQDLSPKFAPKCPMADVPSHDSRLLGGVTPPKKSYSSSHTIAPAYNKGAYQVISPKNIKDIGR